MGHLHNALANLQATLPNTWINAITPPTADDIGDPQIVANIELQVATILDPVATSFFDFLNFSIIEGEYVEDIVTYETLLTDIENYLNLIANFDITGFPQITSVCQEKFRGTFYNAVRRSLKSYKILLDFVKHHLDYHPNTSIILQTVKRDADDATDTNSTAEEMSALFQLNLGVASIDHTLSFGESTFSRLLRIQNSLRNLSTSTPAKEILEKKCGFLLYKISFRLKQSQQNFLYGIDFNYTAVQLNPIADFSEYNDIINGHYNESVVSPAFFVTRCSNAFNKFNTAASTLDLNDYHALIKYFKDDKKDLAKLYQLKNHYNIFYTSAQATNPSLFDKNAYNITYCYLLNNILSLELDKKELKIENWQAKLKQCTNMAEQLLNRNFFPYYKIVKEFLGTEIWNQFSKSDYDFTIISSLISEYELNLTKLIEHVGICDETDYLPFQNSYSNCLVPITDSTGVQRNCFISSSFAIPLNYKKFKEELEIYKAKLTQFNTTLNIQTLIDEDRKDIKKVKQEIERTDKRHIEILSIFAALVMFVSNEIQIFSKIPNMGDAVAYTLFFAFGLGLFVLMIWFITRPDGIRKIALTWMHWFVIVIFSLGLISAIAYASYAKFHESNNQRQIRKMNFLIDSLQHARAIDSLSRQLIVKKSPAKDSIEKKPSLK